MKILAMMTSAIAISVGAPAYAQSNTSASIGNAEESAAGSQIVILSDWNYDPLYASGWSIERIFDETEIIDPKGEEIGDVENVVFGDNGRVLTVIAEVGGFWDIGDTHVSIPWNEVELSAGAETMTVPVTEDSVDEYSVFGSEAFLLKRESDEIAAVDDDLATGPEAFKATDLIGDYVYLEDNERYGYVNDLIVNGGELSAIVVDSAAYGRPGYYAYPYGIGGWRPYDARYDLPYGGGEISVIQVFDYDRMRRDGGTDATSTSSSEAQPDPLIEEQREEQSAD